MGSKASNPPAAATAPAEKAAEKPKLSPAQTRLQPILEKAAGKGWEVKKDGDGDEAKFCLTGSRSGDSATTMVYPARAGKFDVWVKAPFDGMSLENKKEDIEFEVTVGKGEKAEKKKVNKTVKYQGLPDVSGDDGFYFGKVDSEDAVLAILNASAEDIKVYAAAVAAIREDAIAKAKK